MKASLRRETLVLLGFLLLTLIGMALPGKVMREGIDGDMVDSAAIQARSIEYAKEAGCPQPAPGEPQYTPESKCGKLGYPAHLMKWMPQDPEDKFWKSCKAYESLVFDGVDPETGKPKPNTEKGPIPFKWTTADMARVCAERQSGECGEWISANNYASNMYDAYCGKSEGSGTGSYDVSSVSATDGSRDPAGGYGAGSGQRDAISGNGETDGGGRGRLSLKDIDRRLRRLEAESGRSSKSFT